MNKTMFARFDKTKNGYWLLDKSTGEKITRLDEEEYTIIFSINSSWSAYYENSDGILMTASQVNELNLEIEA